MKTITMIVNKPALTTKKFKKGWIAYYPDPDIKGFFNVIVNKEQYEAMDGNEFDPWDKDDE